MQAFLAGSIALTFWLVLEVATFASVHSLRVEERNMFYVVPLFLIALLALDRPRLRRGPRAVAWPPSRRSPPPRSPAALPYTKLIGRRRSPTRCAAPLWSLAPLVRRNRETCAGSCSSRVGACRAVPVRAPRATRWSCPAARPRLLRDLAEADRGEVHGRRRSSTSSRGSPPRTPTGSTARSAATRRWRRSGRGNTDKYSVWENEFFNRSVRHFYYTCARRSPATSPRSR